MKLESQVCTKWKPVKEYEGLYEVSSTGLVRAVKRSGSKGGILVPANSKGYNRVVLSKGDKRKNISIHRIVAEAWLTNDRGLPCVNHKDGNKLNNCIDNLEWCDHKWNSIHATSILGIGVGEKNGRAKLTNREVELLKYLKQKYPSISSEYVASFFGMTGTAILDMWNGKIWKTTTTAEVNQRLQNP